MVRLRNQIPKTGYNVIEVELQCACGLAAILIWLYALWKTVQISRHGQKREALWPKLVCLPSTELADIYVPLGKCTLFWVGQVSQAFLWLTWDKSQDYLSAYALILGSSRYILIQNLTFLGKGKGILNILEQTVDVQRMSSTRS